jgi:hypothetical protein
MIGWGSWLESREIRGRQRPGRAVKAFAAVVAIPDFAWPWKSSGRLADGIMERAWNGDEDEENESPISGSGVKNW